MNVSICPKCKQQRDAGEEHVCPLTFIEAFLAEVNSAKAQVEAGFRAQMGHIQLPDESKNLMLESYSTNFEMGCLSGGLQMLQTLLDYEEENLDLAMREFLAKRYVSLQKIWKERQAHALARGLSIKAQHSS